MIMFFVGMVVGAFVILTAIAMIEVDVDDQQTDMCHGCPYEDYSAGKKDCMFCHEASDDLG